MSSAVRHVNFANTFAPLDGPEREREFEFEEWGDDTA